MTEDTKPFVHELKAADYTLNDWRTLNDFPREHLVEVRDADGKVGRAFWRDGEILVEPGGPQQPVAWRWPVV